MTSIHQAKKRDKGRLASSGLMLLTLLASSSTASASVQQIKGLPKGATSSAAQPAEIASRLRENGAAQCAPQINAAGAAMLAGATQYDSLSNWNSKDKGNRSVTVALAQRYPAGEPIPSGVSAIVATPVAAGRCDTVAVQVVPSPLSCAALRSAMANRAKLRGELVGVAVMQQGPTETLLLPAAANTCVVIDLTTAYAP